MTTHHEPDGDDDLAALLRLSRVAGRVDEQRTSRVREAVHQAWATDVRRRRRRAVGLWLAGSAAAAATLVFLVRPWLPTSPGRTDPGPASVVSSSPVVATVRFVRGDVRGRADKPVDVVLGVGDAVSAGGLVVTGDLATGSLTLADGTDLRVGPASTLVFKGPRHVELQRGRVYVDTGQRGSLQEPLEIVAGAAVVRDIGTRFLVARDGNVSVGVRDGRVQVTQHGAAHEATPGEHLLVSMAGVVTRSHRRPYGREWDWIVQAAPPPVVDGRTLEEFLTWVEREGGRAVRFADVALRESARHTVVYGSIDGLSIEDALRVILPTCGLGHRAADDVIVIVAADEPRGLSR